MSLFSRILDKLGIRKAEAATSASAPPMRTTASAGAGSAPRPAAPQQSSQPVSSTAQTRPTAVPVAEVLADLERKAATAGQKLNWRTSIVDLLKLLDLDSSLAARRELAVELGVPTEMLQDSAQMNTWLHRTVLRRIAENGGDIPRDLLD